MERVAFVSGAARGIGHAIALKLVESGTAVAIGDLRHQAAAATAEAIKAKGGRVLAVPLDVTDSASVSEASARAAEALGPVDILVNNAGWDELRPFLETEEPFWDKVIDINFKGCLRMTRALLPGMVEREWGRVISIGSDAGRVGSSLESVYSGAKGGVIA